MGRALEFEHGRSVVRHELFQEAMGVMNRLGEELVGVDARLMAESLRLAEERHKLKVAINLGRHQRELDNAKAEASLATSREACSRALEEAREADRRRKAAEKRAKAHEEVDRWVAKVCAGLEGRHDLKLQLAETEAAGRAAALRPRLAEVERREGATVAALVTAQAELASAHAELLSLQKRVADAEAIAWQNREEVLQQQTLEHEHAPMLQGLRNRANTALGHICDENAPHPHTDDYASHLRFFTEVVTRLENRSERARQLVEERSRSLLGHAFSHVFSHLQNTYQDIDFDAAIAPVPHAIRGYCTPDEAIHGKETKNERKAEASAQATEERANTADENQAAEENESTRADEDILAGEESARATSSVAPEEQARPAEASSAAPEDTDNARIPSSSVQTEEIHTGSKEPQASLLTIPEEVPATSVDVHVVEEKETQAVTDDIATEIPQPAALETVIQEVVKTLTDTPQPKAEESLLQETEVQS
nr:caldesmon-like [Aegilops tauschii subsp. strangulata]